SVTCSCGQKLAVKEEMAGKRVKCPACQSVLTVPGGAEEAPAPKRTTKAVSDGDGAAGARKNNMTMWLIGGGVGAVLLLGCCCLGTIGSWFLFFSGGPEKKLVGKWGIDIEA